jgi:DNA processing protein
MTEGVSREQADRLQDKSLTRAEEILDDCRQKGFRLLTLQDAGYPARLRNIYDPPCLLYIRGHLPVVDEEVTVAMVGTRDCTPYGVACAEKLGGQMAASGAVVVTGLARGIDSAAAYGALRNGGRVIGVLGCGLDVVYPPENRYLYEDVAAIGTLISEYPPGTEPHKTNFPVRNRIISGLSLATLVVEAPETSGALITAETALEQGRDVYAVPGPIDAPTSRGCNRLLRDGAGLVSDGWDLLRDYADRYPGKLHPEGAWQEAPKVSGYQSREERPQEPAKKLPELLSISKDGGALTDDQLRILRTLTDDPMAVDDLIDATQIPARRVLSALTLLEIDQYVAQVPGKRYVRNVLLTD